MGNVPYSLWHLNTESPIGSAVWGSLGGKASLEKMHGGGADFEVKQTNKNHHFQFPFSALSLWFELLVSLPTAMPAAWLFPALWTLTLWKYKQIKLGLP